MAASVWRARRCGRCGSTSGCCSFR
jgi:hypothetical protein